MQSGSSEVLKEMNRRYNRDEYIEIATKIRNRFKDVTLTSDFIAGFPGETDEQFNETITIIDELGIDYCNTAAYSPREFTKAAKMVDKFVPEEIKMNRLQILNDKNKEACLKSNQKFVGRELEILIESFSEKNGVKMCSGRARNNKIIHFPSSEHNIGDFVNVKVEKAQTWCLYGSVV